MSFDVDGLIALVKKYVFIYDISNSKYKNACLKAEVWKSIAEKLGTDSVKVRHKWKTIRDGYMKYKKQVQQAEGTGKKVMEYVWSSQLSFLDNYNATRKSANKADRTQVQMYEEESSPYPSSAASDSEETEPPTKRKRNTEPGQVDHILNILNHQSPKLNDAVDHLFMSYAETFKKFNTRQQAKLKIELAQLFSNAELKELNKHGGSSPKSDNISSICHFTIKEEVDDNNIF